MDWKVVAKGSSPSAESVDALTGLTGLRRDEVLLALARGTLVASSGLTEHRAQILSDSLSRDPDISCRVIPDTTERSAGPRFTVLLSGFAPGYRTRLRRKLQELTGLPPEQVVLWLSRMPFVLSRDVDGDTARRIRNLISSAGGIVTVEADKGVRHHGRRSDGNAVFATPEPSTVPPAGAPGHAVVREAVPAGVPEDAAAEKEPPGSEEDDLRTFTRGEPPVSPPCEGSAGPPPGPRSRGHEGIQGQTGPPERFTPGAPSAGHSLSPVPPGPVPARSRTSAVPHRFSFDPPDCPENRLPRIVGIPLERVAATGPVPHVTVQFPPPATLPGEMLLPGIIVLPDRRTKPVGEPGPPPVLDAAPCAEPDPRSVTAEVVSTPPIERLQPILPDREEVEDGPPPGTGPFREPRIPPEKKAAPTAGPVSEPPPVITAAAPSRDTGVSPKEPASAGVKDRATTVTGRTGRKRRRRPVMPVPPPAGHQPPPELASLHMYVCSPAPGARDSVVSALEEVLGLPRSMAEELLESCPSWLAGFRSSDKAAEVQGSLERRGATVTLTRNLMPSASAGGEVASKGFQDWLSADG